MNKKDFINYSNHLASGRPSPDLFDKYHADRMGELSKGNNQSIYNLSVTGGSDGVTDREFDLAKMLTVNEDAILRLYAVALDPSSSHRELLDSFNIFINDVMAHHNHSLRKFGERLKGRDE